MRTRHMIAADFVLINVAFLGINSHEDIITWCRISREEEIRTRKDRLLSMKLLSMNILLEDDINLTW